MAAMERWRFVEEQLLLEELEASSSAQSPPPLGTC
jgi:hypothetical protein